MSNISIIQQKNKMGNRVDSQSEYFESIQNDKPGTRLNKTASVNIFNDFIRDRYGHPNAELLIQDMLENPEMVNGVFQVLHEFVQWTHDRISYATLVIYLCWLRKYLHARGVKIDVDDMNEYFSKNGTMKIPLKEKKYATKLHELQSIIGRCNLQEKQLYLVLISSGMRIGEALSIRKNDLNFEYDRVMITIRAEHAKNKEERITFISEEARRICQPLFDMLCPDELVFGTETISRTSNVTNENQVFDRLRKRLGLVDRYKSGTHKITLHSMRAFFISKMIKVNENLGHALSGHSSYMKQYERLEISELIEAYIKSESELTIIDLTRKDDEIKSLKNANMQNNQLRIQNKMLEDIIKKLPISNEIKSATARSLKDEDYLE